MSRREFCVYPHLFWLKHDQKCTFEGISHVVEMLGASSNLRRRDNTSLHDTRHAMFVRELPWFRAVVHVVLHVL